MQSLESCPTNSGQLSCFFVLINNTSIKVDKIIKKFITVLEIHAYLCYVTIDLSWLFQWRF